MYIKQMRRSKNPNFLIFESYFKSDFSFKLHETRCEHIHMEHAQYKMIYY